MSTSRITAISCTLALSLASMLACSTSSGDGNTTEIMGTDKPESGAPGAPAAPAAPVETPVTPPKKDAGSSEPPPGECSSEASQTSCVTCCSNKHEDGAAVYFVALIDCMCLEANCAKECKTTLCDPENPKNADADCQTCVQQKNGACASTIKTTCTGDADCVAFDACVGQSDCTGKTN